MVKIHNNVIKIKYNTINYQSFIDNYKVYLSMIYNLNNFENYENRILLYFDNEYYYFPYSVKDYVYKIYSDNLIEEIKYKEVDEDNKLFYIFENFKPRDWQEKAKNIILKNNYNRGIIKIPTGAGKTFFIIYLMSFLNQRYVVIVDDKNILNQWLTSIKSIYSNITDDDILVINSNYNKKNLEKDLNDKKIVISTVQSFLSMMKLNFKYYQMIFKKSKFNAVIYDEAHQTSSANLYSKTLTLFEDFKYIFGLTATPKISTFPIHLLSIGNIIVDADMVGYNNEYKYKSVVNIIKVGFKEPLKLPPYLFSIEKKSDYNSYAKLSVIYNTIFEENKNLYNLLMKALLKDLINQRKILVSVNKIQTVNILYQIIEKNYESIYNYIKRDIKVKKLTSEEKDRDLNNNKYDIIISTYKISSKGLDVPYIDTLYLTKFISGNTSLTQLFGRLFRIYEDKKPPKINIFVEKNYFDKYIKEDRISKTILSIFDYRNDMIDKIKYYEVII